MQTKERRSCARILRSESELWNLPLSGVLEGLRHSMSQCKYLTLIKVKRFMFDLNDKCATVIRRNARSANALPKE